MSYTKYDSYQLSIQVFNGSAWVDIPMASCQLSRDYTLETHGPGDQFNHPPSPVATPIVGSETASIMFSQYVSDRSELMKLYNGDSTRVHYRGHEYFLGQLDTDSVHMDWQDPTAHACGKAARADVTWSCGGFYSDQQSSVVYWGTTTNANGDTQTFDGGLPGELWETRIRRWVTVTHE